MSAAWLGAQAAKAGHGLRGLASEYLEVRRASWPRVDRRTAVALLAAVGQAFDAFADEHERAQKLAVCQEEAVRRESVDDLLYGRSDLGRLAERVERFGLLSSRAHAVAVAAGSVARDDTTRPPDRVTVGRPHPGAGGVVHFYEEVLNALDPAGRLVQTTVIGARPLGWPGSEV
jgi:hypothetical protein